MTVIDRSETARKSLGAALAPHARIDVWPEQKALFEEGGQAAGVFVIHSGQVDLTFTTPRAGDCKSLFVAGPGEILGLSCVVANRPHDCSAMTRTECITGFVDSNRFLRLLDESPELWLDVLRMISTNINACWDCLRAMR